MLTVEWNLPEDLEEQEHVLSEPQNHCGNIRHLMTSRPALRLLSHQGLIEASPPIQALISQPSYHQAQFHKPYRPKQ